MTRPGLKSIGLTLAALGVAAGAWFFLAPQAIGGRTGYVITHGSSMEPGLHEGDLALVRRAAGYDAGDVVAYRSSNLGEIVLHRVARIEDRRLVTRGDANSWFDSERPSQDEVVGRLWLRVPMAGTVLGALKSPRNAAIALVFVSFLTLGAFGARARDARRRPRSEPAPAAFARLLPTAPAAVPTALAVFALVGLLVATLAYTRPSARTIPSAVDFRQRGQFAYTAAAPSGPVYGGSLATGDPVFLRLVSRISVSFTYWLDASAHKSISGTARLTAEVADTNGWKRTFELAPASPFAGDRATVGGTLDLQRIAALLREVEKATGVQRSAYTLTLVPQVRVSGTVAGEAIETTFAPRLPFQLDQLQLQTPAGSSTSGAALRPVEAGSVELTRVEALGVTVSGHEFSVSALRLWAPLAALVFLIAALASALRARGGGTLDEPARIQRRHGALFVSVSRLPAAHEDAVQVAAIEGLVRLAEQARRPLLHQVEAGVHTYVLEDDSGVYSYRAYERAARPLRDRSNGVAVRFLSDRRETDLGDSQLVRLPRE